MAIGDGHGFPLSVLVASASPHEIKLVEPTVDQRVLAETRERMIGDGAYDSESLTGASTNDTACNSSRPTISCALQRRRRTGVFWTATGVAGKNRITARLIKLSFLTIKLTRGTALTG
jgi:hypothetical protein